MVELNEAYKIAYDFFLDNEYLGIEECRETENEWILSGKSATTVYGYIEVCAPKNGTEPFGCSIIREPYMSKCENAKTVNLRALIV